jgi:hypothetical protein
MTTSAIGRWLGTLSLALVSSVASAQSSDQGAQQQNDPGAGGGASTAQPQAAPREAAMPSGHPLTGMHRARIVPVKFTTHLVSANGCGYDAMIRGNVAVYMPGGKARGGAAQPARGGGPRTSLSAEEQSNGLFVPTLNINSTVKCGASSAPHLRVATLEKTPLTSDELAQAIGLRAQVLNLVNNRVCAYVPSFAFSDGRLSASDIRETCIQSSAVGGGPRSNQ